MKLKAVIFDFDEVIIRSYKDHLKAFIVTLKKHGYEVDKKQIEKMFGKSAKDILKQLYPEISDKELEKIRREKEREYRKIVKQKGVKTLPYVKEFVSFLSKNGFKLAIASSASRKNILLGLKITGLNKFFKPNVIVASEDVKKHKPHPEPLLKAAKLIKVNPKHAAYVGDSIYEMIAAKKAGMKAWAILSGYYSKKQLKQAGADFIAKNFRELKNYVIKTIL